MSNELPAQPCRSDGRCQYAIDHGAEGLGQCSPQCCMPLTDHATAAKRITELEAKVRELQQKLDAALDVVVDLGGEVRLPEIEEAKKRRADAERYQWLRDNTDSNWAICEWSHDAYTDASYYRDSRAAHVVDAAIDQARAALQKEGAHK